MLILVATMNWLAVLRVFVLEASEAQVRTSPRLAITDPLTASRIGGAHHRDRRAGAAGATHIVALALDLNGFKALNDRVWA